MSCPQIWKIEKDREKEKVRLQASEAQREKELDELKKKKQTRRHFLLEEQHKNFGARQGENERQ